MPQPIKWILLFALAILLTVGYTKLFGALDGSQTQVDRPSAEELAGVDAFAAGNPDMPSAAERLVNRMSIIAEESPFVDSVVVDGSIIDVNVDQLLLSRESKEMAKMVAQVFSQEKARIVGGSNVTARIVYSGRILAWADANSSGIKRVSP